MNKPIRELAEQAEEWNEDGGNNKYKVNLEEFAYLILAEMYIFMCNSTDNHKPWPSFKKVKAHFGIEK